MNKKKIIEWENYDPIAYMRKINRLQATEEEDESEEYDNDENEDENEEEEAKPITRLYLLHSNFYITDKLVEVLSNLEGIEAFKPLSPYRAMVGFGKLFDSDTCKKNVQTKLSGILIKQKKPTENTLESLNINVYTN